MILWQRQDYKVERYRLRWVQYSEENKLEGVGELLYRKNTWQKLARLSETAALVTVLGIIT
jgi:hypothetical protein